MLSRWWMVCVFVIAAGASVCHAVDLSPVLTEHQKVQHWQVVALVLLAVMAVVAVTRRFKIDAFVGEILAGVLLGTGLAYLLPELHAVVFPDDRTQRALLEHLGELGVLFLLLQSGMEVHPSEARRHLRGALWIGAGGLLIPVLLGYGATLLFMQYVPFTPSGGQSPHLVALFMGNTMAISAMVIIVRVFKTLDIGNSEFGKVILCGYAVNDLLGWILYGAIFQMAAGGSASLWTAGGKLLLAIGATGVALQWAPRYLDRWLGTLPAALRQTRIYGVVVALTLGLGVLTDALGCTMYFGVFVAGMVLAGSKHVTHELRERLTALTEYVMCPIYFVLIGTQLNFTTGWSWSWVLLIAVGGLLLKFGGAYVCAIFAGRPRNEWYAIGVACVPGGVNGVVFGSLALSYGLIDDKILGGIVASAALSSWVVGPWLRRAAGKMDRKVQPRRLRDIVTTGLFEELPRCDAPNREVALRLRVLDKVGGTVGIKATALRQVFDQAQRGETRILQGVAYLHGNFPVEQEVIFVFWSGREIPWGESNEPVRFVVVRLTPREQLGVTSQRQVFSFLQGIVKAKLAELGDDEAARKQVHAGLLKIIAEIDGVSSLPPSENALTSVVANH